MISYVYNVAQKSIYISYTTTTNMDIKCKHCGHDWIYKGTHLFVTCPNCMKKTKKQNGTGITTTEMHTL